MTVELDLAGSVAVVTGGTRGIGRAIAERLAEAGADVVPTARTESEVEDAAAAIRDRGRDSLAIPVDVTDRAAVAALFEQTAADLGSVIALVNNAGINPLAAMGEPQEVSPDEFREAVAVNLQGTFACTHEAGAYLLADGGGSVVNVASTSGLVGTKRQHAYVASKHGVVGLTKSVALDWAPTVRANAIAPGYAETDMTADLRANEDLYESIRADIPTDRFAAPGEVADAAVFLASDAAAYVTGECLAVDGGWTAR